MPNAVAQNSNFRIESWSASERDYVVKEATTQCLSPTTKIDCNDQHLSRTNIVKQKKFRKIVKNP